MLVPLLVSGGLALLLVPELDLRWVLLLVYELDLR